MSADTIPLTVVAAELGADTHALTRRLGTEIIVDENTGLRVVSVATCRRLVNEKAARDAATRAQIHAAGNISRQLEAELQKALSNGDD